MDEEGWNLTDLTCDDPDAVIDLAERVATVDVAEAETVTCTFTNEEDEPEPGTLIIEKVTDPTGADETFDFVTLAGEDLVLAEDELGDGEMAVHEVDAGEYIIVEMDEEGWNLTDLTCDDPDAVIDLEKASPPSTSPKPKPSPAPSPTKEIPNRAPSSSRRSPTPPAPPTRLRSRRPCSGGTPSSATASGRRGCRARHLHRGRGRSRRAGI